MPSISASTPKTYFTQRFTSRSVAWKKIWRQSDFFRGELIGTPFDQNVWEFNSGRMWGCGPAGPLGLICGTYLISDRLSGTNFKMTSRRFILYIIPYLAMVRSDSIVVSVLASSQMDMVQVPILVPMLVDFDMCISHSIVGLRRSSSSTVLLLVISSSLVN